MRDTKEVLIENMNRKLYKIDLKFEKIIICEGKYTFSKIRNDKRELKFLMRLLRNFVKRLIL